VKPTKRGTKKETLKTIGTGMIFFFREKNKSSIYLHGGIETSAIIK
jgi:hypothetical protein